MSTDPAAPAPQGTPPPAHTDQPNWGAFYRVAVFAALAGWALFVVAGVVNWRAAETETARHDAKARFFVGYLTGYIYWFSLPLGGMALLMIRYLAKTSWGLLLTRPMEAATRTLPLMILLWLPLAIAVVFTPVGAFIGAAAVIGAVYFLGRRDGQLDSNTLLLSGIVFFVLLAPWRWWPAFGFAFVLDMPRLAAPFATAGIYSSARRAGHSSSPLIS